MAPAKRDRPQALVMGAPASFRALRGPPSPRGQCCTAATYWTIYITASLAILGLLCVDPLFSPPSGLISLELLTKEPVRHGLDPCSWDYDGSWKVGAFSGRSPLRLNTSERPAISCITVNTTSVSFVSTPFVHIPTDEELLDPNTWTAFFEMRNLATYVSEIGVAVSRDRGATWEHLGTALAEPGRPLSAPFVVYDSTSKSYLMLPDVQEPVRREPDAAEHSFGVGLPAYTTTPEEFPFGWRLSARLQLRAPAWPGAGPRPSSRSSSRQLRRAASAAPAASAGPAGPGQKRPSGPLLGPYGRFAGTVAAQHDGRWWVFTTHIQPAPVLLRWLVPPRVTPLIYTTPPGAGLLTSPWLPHPASASPPLGPWGWVWGLARLPPPLQSLAGPGSGSGGRGGVAGGEAAVRGIRGPLRAAGRPFVWRGSLHRWAHGMCAGGGGGWSGGGGMGGGAAGGFGEACSGPLLLARAVVANETHYVEEIAARYNPAGDRSWRAQQLGHADVRPLPPPPASAGAGEEGATEGEDRRLGERRGASAASGLWLADTGGSEGAEGGAAAGAGGEAAAGEEGGEEGGEEWWGLVSGDRYVDGRHHYMQRERWFVDLKAQLRNLVAAQLLLVITAAALQASYAAPAPSSRSHLLSDDEEEAEEGGGGPLKGGAACGPGSCAPGLASPHHPPPSSAAAWLLLLPPPLLRGPAGVALYSAADAAGRRLGAAYARVAACLQAADSAVRRFFSHPGVQTALTSLGLVGCAFLFALCVMTAAPGAVPCPRWAVAVRPFRESPHYVPARPFVDPGAPYDVSNLTIISGCTQSFMDRLQNLVGSLQHWEPRTPITVYDLGFTSSQLAEIRCWKGVDVVRFPYEDYPPHVREISTYAFKGLVFDHALQGHPGGILWLDCGLEVRAPLDSLRAVLSAQGHVSAQQSMAPEDFPYTEQYEVPFFNLSQAQYARVRSLPFCAAGVQGFVRGSAAERLVLGPTVACSLDAERCMAPPGHSRANHLYEQTALTLNLRLHNFSSVLPRETHCTSSVKKVSWDPFASSAPIVLTSRRHRWPKPYQHRVLRRPACAADPASNPWRSVSSEHPETVLKSASLLFTLLFVWGQAAADLLVQAGCCVGFHALAHAAMGAALLLGEAVRRSWRGCPPPPLPLLGHRRSPSTDGGPCGCGGAGPGGPGGLQGALGGGPVPWLWARVWAWIGRRGPVLAAWAMLACGSALWMTISDNVT